METEMESRIADPFSWDGHEAETLLVCESGSGRAETGNQKSDTGSRRKDN